MGKLKAALAGRFRLLAQIVFTAVTNGYAAGFAGGRIFTGDSKAYCLPGLNCYSCPGALGACPIGSLQAVLGSRSYQMSFYVAGFLLMIGAIAGRFVCGWLCPFGLFQDLLHRLPFVSKLRRLPGERWLRWCKYILLAGFVIVLPMFAVDLLGQGQPWFCKYICPSGTLMAGIPLLAANPPLRAAAGWLFAWKGTILAVLVVLSLLVWRPFCRYLCPLGAVYGLFNPVSLLRLKVEGNRCTRCGKCQSACKLDLKVWQAPNAPDCVRCGVCMAACPHGALHVGLAGFDVKRLLRKEKI